MNSEQLKDRPCFDLDTDATEDQIATLLKLTERYCVVAKSLRARPSPAFPT